MHRLDTIGPGSLDDRVERCRCFGAMGLVEEQPIATTDGEATDCVLD